MRRGVAVFLGFLAVGACATERERESERIVSAHASVEIPARASGAVRVEDTKTNTAIRFAVAGAANVARARDEDRVVYSAALQAGADFVLSFRDDGVEDSIRFERKPAQERTLYDVDVSGVAGLRSVANTLEFLDTGGAPRLRVGAPFVTGADGIDRPAKLSVRGCALDTDPRPPWGRPVTPPGAAQCEVEVSWEGLGGVYPLTVDPAWTAAGSLSNLHGYHGVAVLPSGRVLVAGGRWGSNLTEIFDPQTETWALTAPMLVGRAWPSAVALDSGDVLLIGGNTSTELYNEARGTWVAGPPATTARNSATLVKLPSGQVLAAGGASVAGAEVYDPQKAQWSAAGTMSGARIRATASLLKDGTVLVAGGNVGGQPTNTAEIFTPPSTWTPTAPMNDARDWHAATTLVDGRVLVTAGTRGVQLTTADLLDSAELFDPVARTWSAAGHISLARSGLASVLLRDGRVLVVGGSNTSNVRNTDIFDPRNGSWVPAGFTLGRRWAHTATLLSNGKVLVAGPNMAPTEVFLPAPSGASCYADGECAVGFCVDGVCCDQRCSGPCVACTAKRKGSGVDGVCGPMPAGAPDPGCPTLPASTCGATGLCDGAGACALQPSGVTCGPDVCDQGVLTKAACSGRGICKQVTTSCTPFVCASGAACGTGPCATDADCADAFWCDARGECVPAGCDGDHVVVGADRTRTDCAPYRCDTQGCKTRCRSTTDCAEAFVCNTDHACIPIDEARRDYGRPWLCAASTYSPRSGGWLALGPFLVGLARRHRKDQAPLRPSARRPACP